MMKYATKEIKVGDNEYLVFYDNDERLYDVNESIRIGKRLSDLNEDLFSNINNFEDLVIAANRGIYTLPSTLVENYEKVILKHPYLEKQQILHGIAETSGTGGKPKRAFFIPEDVKRVIYQFAPIQYELTKEMEGRKILYLIFYPPFPAVANFFVGEAYFQYLQEKLKSEEDKRLHIRGDFGIWIYGRPDIKEIMFRRLKELISQADAVFLFLSPTRLRDLIVEYFLKNPKDAEKIQAIQTGAEYLPPQILETSFKVFTNLKGFMDVYGSTEMGAQAIKVCESADKCSSFVPRATLFILKRREDEKNSFDVLLTKLYSPEFNVSYLPLMNYKIGDVAILRHNENGYVISDIIRDKEFYVETKVGSIVRDYFPNVIDYLVIESPETYRILLGFSPTTDENLRKRIVDEIIERLFNDPRFLFEVGRERLKIEEKSISDVEMERRKFYPTQSKTLHHAKVTQ